MIQFIKFGMVGLSNTVIGYIIYAVTLFALQSLNAFPSCDVYIAQFVMFLLSVAWSFYWNNRFVFINGADEKNNIFLRLMKSYISYAFTGLFLSELLLVIWVEVLRINGSIAPIINLLVTVPLNFVLQKKWVFKEKDKNTNL